MPLRMMLFVVSSFFLLSCSIDRPDSTLYVVNAPGKKARGYNLRDDYDQDGNLKPGTKPREIPAGKIQDLNKFICTDPDGFANLKAYIQKMREAYRDCQ